MKTIDKTLKFDGRRVNTVCEIYDSPMELLEVCKSRKNNFAPRHDYFGNATGDKSWNDFESCVDMWDSLTNGTSNTKLINEVSKNTTRMDRVDYTKRTQFFNNVQGFAPVVPLAIMGVPTNMMDTRTVKMKNKVLNLVWDCALPSYAKPAEVRAVATEVLKQVVGLELSGYRVRLTAVSTFCNDGRSYALGLVIKRENEPMNLKRILFPTTSSAFCRGVAFGWYTRLPGAEEFWGFGRTAYHEYHSGYKGYYEQIFGPTAIPFSLAEFVDAGRKGRLESVVKDTISVKEATA